MSTCVVNTKEATVLGVLSDLGGQYRSPAGVRTLDGETTAQQFARLRGAYSELGEPFPGDRIRKCQTVPSQKTLVERFHGLVEQTKTGGDVSF